MANLAIKMCDDIQGRSLREHDGRKLIHVALDVTEQELEKLYLCNRTGKPCVAREAHRFKGNEDSSFYDAVTVDIETQQRCPVYTSREIQSLSGNLDKRLFLTLEELQRDKEYYRQIFYAHATGKSAKKVASQLEVDLAVVRADLKRIAYTLEHTTESLSKVLDLSYRGNE